MKNLLILIIPFVLLLFGCIGTDIENEQEEILRISENTSTLRVTGTFQFKGDFINSRAQNVDTVLLWNSSNESVLQIDDNGLATGISVGQSEVSVHLGDLSDNMIVEVLESKESITISNFVSALQVGNSFQFEAVYLDLEGQNLVPDDKMWSSSDETILTVSATGNVSAISAGSAMITVSAGTVNHTISVESTSAPVMVDEKVLITNFTESMELEEMFTFEATFFDTSGQPDPTAAISWSSSDNSVLSIESNGVATAHIPGMATITATSGSASMDRTVEVLVPENQRFVTMQGRAGYNITGSGVLKLVNGELLLELDGVGVEGPGPYFYLSNSTTNVNDGINLGKASNGSISINVTDTHSGVTLTQYDYVIVWCEPFNVTLGFGELSN